MSKPTKLAEKNITSEKRSLRVMASAKKKPPADKITKKPAPEKKRRAPEEGLKRKQGEIEVKESKKAKRAIEEKKNSDTEEVSNVKFDNNDDAVKLGLLYMIFYIPLANANSMKIDPKYFALADNLKEFNAFPWGMLSWEATRNAICNAVENRLSSKRIPLKKAEKVHYSIAGFPHDLLIWAYESILTIAGKFTTKYVEANPHLLSWTSVDNVKFDAVMSALIAVGEKQSKCFVIMPTDKELKESYVAQLYLKNPMVVPQAHYDGFVDFDIGVIADKGVKVTMDFLNADKEEGDEEKEIIEDEDDKGENDEIILKIMKKERREKSRKMRRKSMKTARERRRRKKPDTTKEKEKEKKDEEAKGEEMERTNEEAAKEQEESINDVVVNNFCNKQT
ncbi:hypothetical protein TIFTF001_033731 [Ficus carica]|uniref:DUF1985 domain-containing protein n=1 Tax=Ficus carica TaxID=3494 RepID=A0AA88J892_FICCA|nr:hypothetical protein TIFTF001_033731 [Ficus carica]